MPKFLTRLVYSSVEGHNQLWITDAPFVVWSDILGRITVPAGFIFDGNSLPRVMRLVSLPSDYMETGCVHDWLYREGVPRELADLVYRELMGYQGAGKVRRTVRYAALRLFGGIAYREDAEARVERAKAA
jgi:hypothetical protein